MAKCLALKKNCKCGWKVGRGKRVENCPECGADMHCGHDAVVGYAYCSYHGAPAPNRNFYGSGTLMTGSSSQFPLTRLAASYNRMKTDGRVLSNRQSIDIIRMRIQQLAERIDLNEAPDRMAKLYGLWGKYTEMKEKGREAEAHLIEGEITEEFDKVYHDYSAWKQMFDALDMDRKMVESEVKVLTQIHAIMTVEDGYELSAKLLAAVMKVVDNPKMLKQVQYEFTRIIGESGDNAAKGYGEDDWRGGGEEIIEPGPGTLDREELLHPGDEIGSEVEGQDRTGGLPEGRAEGGIIEG